jgi:hypothetical protein
MLDAAQSMNRFAYTYNNPFKFVDPSGNEGLVAEKIQRNLLANSSNTGNETLDWWANFGRSFTAGFTYDAVNFSTLGVAGAVDVMAKDASEGKQVSFTDAWMRNGYAASTSQIATNFLYYGAGAVKGIGNGAYNAVTGIPSLAYGLATDPGETLDNMWLGLAEKTGSVVDTIFEPRKALDKLAQHSQEDIAFSFGETVGEIAFDVATAKVGISALSKTKYGKATATIIQESKTALKTKTGNIWRELNSNQRGSFRWANETSKIKIF